MMEPAMILFILVGINQFLANLASSSTPGSKMLKRALKSWNTTHFGNCHSKVKGIEAQIKYVQKLDKYSNNISLDYALHDELDMWLTRIETLWFHLSKDMWLKDGDANTKAMFGLVLPNKIPIPKSNSYLFIISPKIFPKYFSFYIFQKIINH